MSNIVAFTNDGRRDDTTLSPDYNQEVIITVNGVRFTESKYDTFIVYGEENLFPFMKGVYRPLLNHWRYRSLFMDGTFYVPILIKQKADG